MKSIILTVLIIFTSITAACMTHKPLLESLNVVLSFLEAYNKNFIDCSTLCGNDMFKCTCMQAN